MNAITVLKRIGIAVGATLGVAVTFGTIMSLVYGVAFTTVVPSSVLQGEDTMQATPPATQTQPKRVAFISIEASMEAYGKILTYALGYQFEIFPTCDLALADMRKYDLYIVDSWDLPSGILSACLVQLQAMYPRPKVLIISTNPRDRKFAESYGEPFFEMGSKSSDGFIELIRSVMGE